MIARFHSNHLSPSLTLGARSPVAMGSVLAEVTESPRKAWRISLVKEGRTHLVEVRLCRRAPNGSLTPTQHRSTFHCQITDDISAAFAKARHSLSLLERTEEG